MAEDLPFKTEYAKSGRASCKGCRSTISKDSLRLAKMIQSPHFDGKQPVWFHYSCFFKKNKPIQLSEIAGFDSLRWDDQEKIKQHFSGDASASLSTVDEVDAQLAEFQVDYAKSNRSKCKRCEEKINKDELRVANMVDGGVKQISGKIPAWHHVDCFVEKKEEESDLAEIAEHDISGFDSLKDEDQKKLRKVLGLKKSGKKESSKETKKANVKVTGEAKDDLALKEQSEMLWKLRDNLKSICSVGFLKELLEENGMNSRGGESDILDRCVDAMAFGIPGACPACGKGRLLYCSNGYKCTGHLSAWTKCQYVTFKPPRTLWITSKESLKACDFLKTVKPEVKDRLFPKSTIMHDPENPLAGKKVLLSNALKKSKDAAALKAKEYGGLVVQSVVSDLFCYITTKAEVEKRSKKIEGLISKGIPILPEEFLSQIEKGTVSDTIRRLELVPTKSKDDVVNGKSGKRKGSKVADAISSPKKARLTIKGGAVVDPDSEMEDCCHVFQKEGDIYNAVLGMADLAKNTNSYYKLQVLVHDSEKRYFVFRSWGRVGTTIGGNKLEEFESLPDAISNFIGVYEDKTGNSWICRKNFVKQPYKFYPLEIDYGQDDDNLRKLHMEVGGGSKLPLEVQSLIKMIFDVESMKKTMAEFEIDLNKMPLGKLSRKQIEKGYEILGELQRYIDYKDSDMKILDASNRFYTLIPHDFGLKPPPLLNRADMIKEKMDMLGSLLDIEIAYSLLKSSVVEHRDPIDVHYESLAAKIDVLDKATEDFKLIESYVQNTHAKTHSNYTLDIIDVFTLDRKGEETRYSPFRELHNRKLLWHGSRTSNFAGIISQGLRIAPPEAPVTGYMFGKGIYFADMVSKSANYCRTSSNNPIGLMLLCEVALGNMYELKHAKAIEKLPKGKHSCKGIGRTSPDPNSDYVLPDGVTVPIGKSSDQNIGASSLLYNEFIVYDVAQVRMKYLLKLDFKYKY